MSTPITRLARRRTLVAGKLKGEPQLAGWHRQPKLSSLPRPTRRPRLLRRMRRLRRRPEPLQRPRRRPPLSRLLCEARGPSRAKAATRPGPPLPAGHRLLQALRTALRRAARRPRAFVPRAVAATRPTAWAPVAAERRRALLILLVRLVLPHRSRWRHRQRSIDQQQVPRQQMPRHRQRV